MYILYLIFLYLARRVKSPKLGARPGYPFSYTMGFQQTAAQVHHEIPADSCTGTPRDSSKQLHRYTTRFQQTAAHVHHEIPANSCTGTPRDSSRQLHRYQLHRETIRFHQTATQVHRRIAADSYTIATPWYSRRQLRRETKYYSRQIHRCTMGFWWTASKKHHGILADSYTLHHESPTDSYTDTPRDSSRQLTDNHQTAAPSDSTAQVHDEIPVESYTEKLWDSSIQLHR